MTDTQERVMEAGEETARAFWVGPGRNNPVSILDDRWRWSLDKGAWAAAERKARMSGPLWEAVKALRKAQDGPGSTWNELADVYHALATMEQDPPRD